jgi:hypothetical protein
MASRLMAVTAENRVLIQALAMTTNKSVTIRWPLTIGSGDVDSILISDMGRYKNATPSSIDIPNAFTVVKMAIEDGVVAVPLYKSGSRTWVVNPGDMNTQSDLITASQFGRVSFTQGMRLWIKMELSFASTGMSLPYSDRVTTHVAGSQVLYFDSDATTIVNGVDAVGAFTTSGTAPSSTTAGYCPIILGKFVSAIEPKVLFGNGDSILRGFGDTSFTSVGSGMFQRVLFGAGTNILAGINFARDGSFSTDYLTSPGDWEALYSQYCNIGIDEYSTNDFGVSPGTTQTAATQLSRALSTAQKMKNTYGIQKVIRTKLGCSTTSASTNWTSDVDQTVSGIGWGAGGNVEQFNSGLGTLVGLGVDVVVPMLAWRSPTDQYKFVSTGANDYATADGAHPTTVIYIPLAAEIRSYVDAVLLLPVYQSSVSHIYR